MADAGPLTERALPEMTLAAVVEDVPHAEVATRIKPLFDSLSAALTDAGYAFWGPEIALYHMGEDALSCAIGVELAELPAGLTAVRVPATRALVQWHRLTLPEFPAAHRAMHEAALARGLTPGRWGREVYRGLHGPSGRFDCEIMLDVAG